LFVFLFAKYHLGAHIERLPCHHRTPMRGGGLSPRMFARDGRRQRRPNQLRDAFELALLAKIGLKLSKHTKHVEEALASGGAGVEQLRSPNFLCFP